MIAIMLPRTTLSALAEIYVNLWLCVECMISKLNFYTLYPIFYEK